MRVADTGTAFENPPAGPHPACCYRLIDLGTQNVAFSGATKHVRKLLLTFELLGDERMSDGRPYSVSRRFTASLAEKSALRPFLESWRGRKFTADELKGFDMQKILGAHCLLNLVEQERAGESYMNIASISPLPKSMPRPESVNSKVFLSLDPDEFAAGVLDKLSERLVQQIKASPEFQAIQAKPQAADSDPFADMQSSLEEIF